MTRRLTAFPRADLGWLNSGGTALSRSPSAHGAWSLFEVRFHPKREHSSRVCFCTWEREWCQPASSLSGLSLPSSKPPTKCCVFIEHLLCSRPSSHTLNCWPGNNGTLTDVNALYLHVKKQSHRKSGYLHVTTQEIVSSSLCQSSFVLEPVHPSSRSQPSACLSGSHYLLLIALDSLPCTFSVPLAGPLLGTVSSLCNQRCLTSGPWSQPNSGMTALDLWIRWEPRLSDYVLRCHPHV